MPNKIKNYLRALAVAGATALAGAWMPAAAGENTAVAAAADTAAAVKTAPATSYVPSIHGVVRARWEMATESGEGRFQVRNARVNIGGSVGPVFNYYAMADLCDRGTMKILDAWVAAKVTGWLGVRAGQFRMPFGMDSFRAPGHYLFGNRSFIGKQMCNYRAVGVQLALSHPSIPVELQTGMFNPTSIADHDKWVKTYAYSTKLTWHAGPAKVVTGFQSIEPYDTRINLWNIGASWTVDKLTLEGEFMNKHYTNHRHPATKGWLATANYDIDLRKGAFNTLSFQGRYDGMTGHSTGAADENGALATDHQRRQRMTLGTTLTHLGPKSIKAAVRLNYEKYFYPSGSEHTAADGDKLLVEFVVLF